MVSHLVVLLSFWLSLSILWTATWLETTVTWFMTTMNWSVTALSWIHSLWPHPIQIRGSPKLWRWSIHIGKLSFNEDLRSCVIENLLEWLDPWVGESSPFFRIGEFSLYGGAGDLEFESFWLTLAFLGLLWATSIDCSILMLLIKFVLGSNISLDLGY